MVKKPVGIHVDVYGTHLRLFKLFKIEIESRLVIGKLALHANDDFLRDLNGSRATMNECYKSLQLRSSLTPLLLLNTTRKPTHLLCLTGRSWVGLFSAAH